MKKHHGRSFSTWAIKNPVPPIVLFLVLTIAGLVAYWRLPIDNMPAIAAPIVTVQIAEPGAAAAEMEAQVTRKVENALAGMQGVKHIASTISEGMSITTIEFFPETDFDRAVNDTRDAVSNVRDQLPQSIPEPQVRRIEMDGGAILTYSVESQNLRSEDLSRFVDETLSRELLGVAGVAAVRRQGGVEHEITVALDPAKLMALGVSAAEISRQLALTNIDRPGGRLTVSGTEYVLRTLGSVKTIEMLGGVRIPLSDGRQVRLADLGTITDGGAEQRSIARLDGKLAVTFQVFKSRGASEVTVAKAVERKLAEMAAAHPDITVKQIFSLAAFTETSFEATVANFFEGAALTVFVVFLFLRDRRATIIAAIAIPLSIIPTFLFMYWVGFTLNSVSLLAISLVTGVLVDDAIVEIENIHRHMRAGQTAYVAAMTAANEIGLAVVATTMVICAVFLPVSFMGGLPGQFFRQFGLTVAVAAFFSLVVARLLTPMLAAHLLKVSVRDVPLYGMETYRRLIGWTLDHRLKTVAIATFSLVVSFGIMPFIPAGFMPYQDLGQSRLSVELPRGSTLAQTDVAAQKVMQVLKRHKEVECVLVSIAGGSVAASEPQTGDAVASGVNQADIYIKLVPASDRKLDQRAFERRVLSELMALPDMRVNFASSDGEKDISIVLVGDDGDALEGAAKAIEREMRQIPGLSSVSTTVSTRQPEIVVTPDFAKAAQLGVSVQSISDAISIGTIGDIEANLAKFNYGDRQIPIRVRMRREDQQLSTIENLKLSTYAGNSVPLSAVAAVTYGSGPTSIERFDRWRKIGLEANLNGIAMGDALERIYALPAIKNLPDGVRIQNSGDAEMMGELFAGFAVAIGGGLLMVYAVQVLLYKDWIQPFTRMAALPLSIGGAFVLMLLTGTELSLPALIGILMLMGIADKNSILLVDHMLERIRLGMPRREAIIDACVIRARPIVMTSLAMAAGMLPIALGLSIDSAFRAPMAIATIGGLISSTALSLIFVPTMFSYVRDFEEWLAPRVRRLIV